VNTSEQLFQRALTMIPGGVNSPVRAFRSVGGTPFFTKSADGARLTTADGRELVDFVLTWGPAIHGHNDPDIRAAIREALDRGTSFGTPNPLEVEMAELILACVPAVKKVRMTNSGTEATMSAIRLSPRLHRPAEDHQVLGLLPRTRRFPPGEGGFRRAHAGQS